MAMGLADEDGKTGGLQAWRSVLHQPHPNFRMLGGVTEDGRQVRAGAFLRGPALHDFDEEAWFALSGLGLDLIVDFRGAAEVGAWPLRLPEGLRGCAVSLPVDSGPAKGRDAGSATGFPAHEGLARDRMIEIYRGFASAQLHVFAEFLGKLRKVAGGTAFFHCTAGKDRTGFAAALVLLALGVPREQVMADFMATGDLWRPHRALEDLIPAAARPAVFGVDPAYLEAALDELDRTAGGARAFAARAMGGAPELRAWADQSLV